MVCDWQYVWEQAIFDDNSARFLVNFLPMAGIVRSLSRKFNALRSHKTIHCVFNSMKFANINKRISGQVHGSNHTRMHKYNSKSHYRRSTNCIFATVAASHSGRQLQTVFIWLDASIFCKYTLCLWSQERAKIFRNLNRTWMSLSVWQKCYSHSQRSTENSFS